MRFLFLALLARGPAHGYVLKQLHDELFGPPWPPMNIGQIYVTMGRLERDGLVSIEPDGGRKVYSLTELGRKELDLWMTEQDESSVHKSDLLLRLVAATMTAGPGVKAVIAECRRRLLIELRSLSASIEPGSEGSLAELLVHQAALHIQADLKWLDVAEERLLQKGTRPRSPQIKPGESTKASNTSKAGA
jgi:DNA-binding PadR family transcriptional regulator